MTLGITTQFIRYAIVGLVSNLVLYIFYLILTSYGMGHKLSMSLLYAMGVLQTFYINRRWSFVHQGSAHKALIRYVAAYASGYILNLVILMVLVDRYGLPHQIVQGAMIIFLAFMLFLMQRYWIFRNSHAHSI